MDRPGGVLGTMSGLNAPALVVPWFTCISSDYQSQFFMARLLLCFTVSCCAKWKGKMKRIFKRIIFYLITSWPNPWAQRPCLSLFEIAPVRWRYYILVCVTYWKLCVCQNTLENKVVMSIVWHCFGNFPHDALAANESR